MSFLFSKRLEAVGVCIKETERRKTNRSFFPRSWRGAMIEADQATDAPPSANEKEAAAAPAAPGNPAATDLKGQH